MSEVSKKCGNLDERPDWLAERAVRIEPVSTAESLLTGKRTGNFTKTKPLMRFLDAITRGIPIGYSQNSLLSRTGNLDLNNRDSFRQSREFRLASAEVIGCKK
jgi:hypothetical protein